MSHRKTLGLCLLAPLLLVACEWSDVGDVAFTWRFDGHGPENGSPCRSLGADRIVFQLTGETTMNEVVACDAESLEYPMAWLSKVTDLPVSAYARLALDVPTGSYTVRAYFITADGTPLDAPAPQTAEIRVERGEVARIDFDFPLP